VIVRLRSEGGERTVEAGWLVGCDGAHSAVRKTAGIGFPGRRLFERMLMVDVRARWPYDRDGSTTWMDVGHVLSVTSLPDLPEDLSEEEIVDRVLGEFSRRSGLATDTVSEVRWATEFRVHRRLAETYRRGRVLLAGDAAHIQSRSGGQGKNTGLGDAENLGWKLVEVTLHAATAGSWVVPAQVPAAHAAAAAVHLGQVTALTPVRPTRREVFLIRPDGHLAWRGRAAPEKLSAWLTQVLWPEQSAVAVPATPATTTRSWTRRSTSSSNAAPRARASRPSPGARESRS